MPYRSLLLTICVTCTGFSSQNPQPSLSLLASSPTNLSGSQTVAHSQGANPLSAHETTESDSAFRTASESLFSPLQSSLELAQAPPEVELDYDRLMNLGYEASKQRDYQSALEYFQQALAERPGDYYASAAIRNLEGYLSRGSEVQENASEQRSLWTVFSAFAIVAGVAGLLLFLWSLRQTKSAQPKLSSRKLPQPDSPSPQKPDLPWQQHQHPVWEAERPQEKTISSEADFSPKQQTTRLADFDLLDSLIEELYHPNLTKRRRAIQELGQSGDSRAIMPLIERIIDSNAYEHSLILEALTQISARVLQPMNQALTACLEDPNPQVRKNAIRDLTQLYQLMAQVGQLLNYVTNDTDVEVKQTAQWALSRLNVLEISPRIR